LVFLDSDNRRKEKEKERERKRERENKTDKEILINGRGILSGGRAWKGKENKYINKSKQETKENFIEMKPIK